MFSEADLKDFYMFQNNVYFSFYEDDIIHYRAATKTDIASTILMDADQVLILQSINGFFIRRDSLRELSRGDYYNEIKQRIKEYCNFELVERLGY